MGRQDRDGSKHNVKISKFRNSDFELDHWDQRPSSGQAGVSRSSINTLGGKFSENRGHRSAGPYQREDNPFENGDLQNWNHRQGWDQYYGQKPMRRDRQQVQGGSLIGTGRDHAGKGPKGYSRPDPRVLEDVCETLSLAPDLDASEVEVKVEKGVVYLNGAVESRSTKKRAELIIENVSGVKDVQNLLRINKDAA